MTPLSCLHPQWSPGGRSGPEWRRGIFRTLPEASARDREHAKSVVQWECPSRLLVVTVDEGQLTMSCWKPAAHLPEDAAVHLRDSVRKVFIGDQRPTWTWRMGGDVALQGWEREQAATRSATSSPGPTRPKPEPVYAWHLKEWE